MDTTISISEKSKNLYDDMSIIANIQILSYNFYILLMWCSLTTYTHIVVIFQLFLCSCVCVCVCVLSSSQAEIVLLFSWMMIFTFLCFLFFWKFVILFVFAVYLLSFRLTHMYSIFKIRHSWHDTINQTILTIHQQLLSKVLHLIVSHNRHIQDRTNCIVRHTRG